MGDSFRDSGSSNNSRYEFAIYKIGNRFIHGVEASDHEGFRSKVEWYDLPFYHLPITADSRAQQEQQILDLMTEKSVDLLVLARYMQILSNTMCEQLRGRAINIHHSFLPSFKGAKPYHQAFERGVKIMGATAHYVTSDLDEGPIIEQDIQRVEHYHDSKTMVLRGKNVETIVLARHYLCVQALT